MKNFWILLLCLYAPFINGQQILPVDIYTGPTGGDLGFFQAHDDKFYLRATNEEWGQELFYYKRDGSWGLEYNFRFAHKSSFPDELSFIDDKIYLSANAGSDIEMFMYDGDTAISFNHGEGSTFSSPENITKYKGRLVFSSVAQPEFGRELYTCDLDGENLQRLADITPGGEYSSPSDFTVLNDTLYFVQRIASGQFYLWKYDGQQVVQASDYLIDEISSNRDKLIVYNGALYFGAYKDDKEPELYEYRNGSTQLLQELVAGDLGAYPNAFSVVGGKLYFNANSDAFGNEAFVYNGAELKVVADQGNEESEFTSNLFTEYKGQTYFWSKTKEDTSFLYKYDGIETTLVDSQVFRVNSGQIFGDMVVVSDTLFFVAKNYSDTHRDLYKTVGDSAILAAPRNPLHLSYVLRSIGNDILFKAFSDETGFDLFYYRTCNANFIDQSVFACDSFVYKGIVYRESTTLIDSLFNASGCDSIVSLKLNIVSKDLSQQTVHACKSFDFNGNVLTESGLYIDSLKNQFGCDSLIQLELFIYNTDSVVDSVSACNSYNWNGAELTVAGLYIDTLSNAGGCDSIVSLVLDLEEELFFDTAQACEKYFWQGEWYNTEGDYSIVYSNIHGCDSIHSLHLILTKIDSSITRNGLELVANEDQADGFQWIDCATNEPIQGATDKSFTATSNGSYACAISKDGCTSLSECQTVSNVGVSEHEKLLTIYPNPTRDGKFTIEVQANGYVMEVYDSRGRLLHSEKLSEGPNNIEIQYGSALYLVKVIAPGGESIWTKIENQ